MSESILDKFDFSRNEFETRRAGKIDLRTFKQVNMFQCIITTADGDCGGVSSDDNNISHA